MQDGRSNGLTAPNQQAQEELLQRAQARSGVDPAAIGYIEAHGTGTALGDPVEALALGRALAGQRDPAKPCWLGSVKTNIGHLETAAGIASLIKAALCLHHQTLPRSLHFQTPNPHVPWSELPLRVVTEPRAFPAEAPLAGVSSFGFGGTIAHAILERAPAPAAREPGIAERPLHILTLSARTPQALEESRGRFLAHLANVPDPEIADSCFSANAGREHGHDSRATRTLC